MEDTGVEIADTVSASQKLGEETANELILGAKTIHIAKGKKLKQFAGGEVSQELVSRMLGATGNLRAPTIRFGDRVIVGFNEETYREAFGS